MSTSDEAEAMHWLVKNGHMENRWAWSMWKLGNRLTLPGFSSVSGKLMFDTSKVYHRRRKEKGVDSSGWLKWSWKYQYATRKEAFVTNLKA